jgi:hypothetical protein
MNNTREEFKLDNGIVLNNIRNMDGGGSTHYRDFLSIVERKGNSRYTKALEWCAGPGFIGYALLGNKVCDQLVLMDKYAPAIDSCIETATANNLTDKVTTYVIDAIGKLPDTEKFDLVLGNPPHMWDRDIFLNETKKRWDANGQILDQDNIDLLERLLLDHGQNIHKEFFKNIVNYLLPNADLFISEPGNTQLMPEIVQYAISNGFTLMSEEPMPTMQDNAPGATLFHFRFEGK